jgi:hypothetical protein
VTETASELLARELLAKELRAKELRECLARLPEDRARWTRRADELMEDVGQSAIDESIGILRERLLPAESEKALLGLLLGRGYLLPVLQSVYETDRIRFREVLSMAHAVEPRLHTRIAKRLAELLVPEHLDRLGEILCLFDSVVQMNGLANLTAALPVLKDTHDPRLRARAALLGSSLPNGRHLLELYREEADPRVRVSILKSLWFDNRPIARVVFEEARRDSQPRVRAYGLLGLYRLGDQRALIALAEMADSPQALTRAAARCAMELLREPRFELFLARLRKEFGESPLKNEPVSPAVRSGPRPLHLAVPRIQRLVRGGLRLQVSVRLESMHLEDDEQLDPALRPLDLRAWVDGQPVLNYTMSRVAPVRRLGIGMILPQTLRAASETTPGIRGVLDHLISMPEGELRSAGFYRSGLFMRPLEQDREAGVGSSAGLLPHSLHVPVISQDGFRFAADLKDSSREENLAFEPGELALPMLNRLKVLKPAGHIGVILNAAVKGPPKPSLAESLGHGCQESGFALHLIAVGEVRDEILAPWLVLSRRSGGFQARISTEDELPNVVHRWMLCFRESYCLEFDAPASASRIRLQAVHPAGAGEITVPVETE